MTQDTCGIIMACKKWCIGSGYRDILSNYLSEKCCCPKEYYTDSQLKPIVFEALCDYIDTCDRPSLLLLSIADHQKFHDNDDIDSVCAAFSMIQVRDRDDYVNGFDEITVDKACQELREINNKLEKRER